MNRGMGFLCEARVSDIAMSAYVPRELATEAYLHAANLYSGRLVEVLTMMQSCASAAKLRAAGPFFFNRHQRQFESRLPATRIVNSAVRRTASASAE
jgi:hypothetical protein